MRLTLWALIGVVVIFMGIEPVLLGYVLAVTFGIPFLSFIATWEAVMCVVLAFSMLRYLIGEEPEPVKEEEKE